MKETLEFKTDQREMIVSAMKEMKEQLTGSGLRLFEMVFSKVLEMDRFISLDGMEMIYITQALRKKAKSFTSIAEYKAYTFLADTVEATRIHFQHTHGPKIKKA